MELQYCGEFDSLCIDLRDAPSVDSREVADGVVLDLDEQGRIVGIDIDHASEKLDLSQLEAVAFPAKTVKIGAEKGS